MAAHPSTHSLAHTHLFPKPGAAPRPLVLQPNNWAPACASSLQPGMEWPGRDRLATPAGAPQWSFQRVPKTNTTRSKRPRDSSQSAGTLMPSAEEENSQATSGPFLNPFRAEGHYSELWFRLQMDLLSQWMR